MEQFTYPIIILALVFILGLGFIASPYEINFEDKDEME